MDFKKYPNAAVDEYLGKKPMIIAIPFDEKEPVLMSMLDDSVEHHILLSHFGVNPTHTNRYYRVVADEKSAEWTFVCPPDYEGIKDR